MNIGFIGAGNMAEAIIKGMVQEQHPDWEEIYCFDVDAKKLNIVASQYPVKLCVTNEELIKQCQMVILAVKPIYIGQVLTENKETIRRHKPLLASIAAGVSLDTIASYLDEGPLPVVRVMPNINAMIGEAVTAVCANQNAGANHIGWVMSIFKTIGKTIEIAEKDFSIFTAIAGSAPAFVYLFIDTLARCGVKNGLPKKQALEIAAQMAMGSAKMILNSEEHPWALIDKVCSPGGTTIEGMTALDKAGFSNAVLEAVEAVVAKDRSLLNNK